MTYAGTRVWGGAHGCADEVPVSRAPLLAIPPNPEATAREFSKSIADDIMALSLLNLDKPIQAIVKRGFTVTPAALKCVKGFCAWAAYSACRGDSLSADNFYGHVARRWGEFYQGPPTICLVVTSSVILKNFKEIRTRSELAYDK